MRIIAGLKKGMTLACPPGDTVRPTLDLVRGSIFNILGQRFSNITVLDLFAGTGALGLEALSRGATHATFVEINEAVTQTLSKNIEKCKLSPQSTLMSCDVDIALKRLGRGQITFDFIFIDPPYEYSRIGKIMNHIVEQKILKPTGIVILEHHRKEPVNDTFGDLRRVDVRSFGNTMISFFKYEDVV